MKLNQAWDLVIIGGGPAGATLATFVKKYNPNKKVLLIEKASFPRHHVGESLLIGVVPILKEMGVYNKVNAAGFPKKLGTTYVWGKDRKPWSANFADVEPSKILRGDGKAEEDVKFSWHVRRAEYDAILLEHAAESGTEVRQGYAAEGILEKDDRITGVKVRCPEGKVVDLRCDFLADCSGQSGFLSRFRNIRRYDSRLGNVAIHGYFKGARWKFDYLGHPDKTKLFLCSTKSGWFWYIPVDKDIVSVGFVTHRHFLKKRKIKDLREFYLSALKDCPEIAPLLKSASLMDNFSGSGRDIFVVRDWSYSNESSCGAGWLAAGDACVFVDPILSSGVLLAHMAGHRAACTLSSVWKEDQEGLRKMMWSDYNDYYRRAAASFLATALFWYGNDRNAKRWWRLTRKLIHAATPISIKNKEAFVIIAAGVQDYYERLYQAEDLFLEQYKGPKEYPLYEKGDWAISKASSAYGNGIDQEGVLSLKYPYELSYSFLPKAGTGLMKPFKRLKFLVHETLDPARDVFNPIRLILPPHLKLLKWLDGKSTFRELVDRLVSEEHYSNLLAYRISHKFISDLKMLGVLTVGKKSKSHNQDSTKKASYFSSCR